MSRMSSARLGAWSMAVGHTTCSDPRWQVAWVAADEFEVELSFHLSPARLDPDGFVAAFGQRPIVHLAGRPFRLRRQGLVSRLVIPGYAELVKMEVSIPDPVYEAAEELAARRRCSRSSLYTQALENLLAEADGDDVTARLDAVYAHGSSGLGDAFSDAQARAMGDEPW